MDSEILQIIILLFAIAIFFIVTAVLYERYERKLFNNGICPRCGFPLIYFDTDSQGSRGYSCKRCNHTVWIFSKKVDAEVLEAQGQMINEPKMYDILRPHIGHNIVCVCYGEDNKDPVDICIECEDCGTVLISSEAYDMEV
jgi:DNA-directed RNA polymerase subunit RPC12/RpoP